MGAGSHDAIRRSLSACLTFMRLEIISASEGSLGFATMAMLLY